MPHSREDSTRGSHPSRSIILRRASLAVPAADGPPHHRHCGAFHGTAASSPYQHSGAEAGTAAAAVGAAIATKDAVAAGAMKAAVAML